MTQTIVLLYKDQVPFQWSILINGQKHVLTTPKGPLLEQLVYVVTDIRDLFDLHGTPVTICSPSLIRTVLYDLVLIFPLVNFVPLTDSGVSKVFRNVMKRATAPARKKVSTKGTVFVCSDASKSSTTNLCGWAWYSTAGGDNQFDFGVSEHRSIVHAELDGILRAIKGHANTNFSTLHVSCDSLQSVEWANDLIFSRLVKTHMVRSLTPGMRVLVEEARELAQTKNIRIRWVKGHANHRLNAAADFLSREARIAANRNERLDRTSPQITGILSFMG